MTYIAFIGYNEQDFKNFKIGNKAVQICNKSDYPDPNDYIFRQSTQLGIKGEDSIENILNKLNKDERFKGFEVINVSKEPHCGDLLFINQNINICFMIECKNKKSINVKEDLNKFDNDIINVNKLYKCNTIGVFLQVGSNKITNHDNIELNDKTIYLTRNYINSACLSVLFAHYIKMNSIENNKITSYDSSFMEIVINDLENMKRLQTEETNRITKIIHHNERDIKHLNYLSETINSQTEIINKIIDKYNKHKIYQNDNDDSENFYSDNYEEDEEEDEEEEQKETKKQKHKKENEQKHKKDNKELLSKKQKETKDNDIFDFDTNNIKSEAQSCFDRNRILKNKLFSVMYKSNIAPSKIGKRDLLTRFPEYGNIIRNSTVDKLVNDYKIFLKQK